MMSYEEVEENWNDFETFCNISEWKKSENHFYIFKEFTPIFNDIENLQVCENVIVTVAKYFQYHCYDIESIMHLETLAIDFPDTCKNVIKFFESGDYITIHYSKNVLKKTENILTSCKKVESILNELKMYINMIYKNETDSSYDDENIYSFIENYKSAMKEFEIF